MSAPIDSADYFYFFEQTFVSSHPYNYIAIPFCSFSLFDAPHLLFFVSSLFLPLSLCLLCQLSLLVYTAFVIKYGLKTYSLFVPPISCDYRETAFFFTPFSLRL